MPDLYLSQWRLHPRLHAVRRALGDSQAMHRLVMSAFPDMTPEARQTYGVLYRVEIAASTGIPTLLLQSCRIPDPSQVLPLLLSPALPSKEVSHIYEAIIPDAVCRFRLRANPTRRVNASHTGDPLAGKRVNLRTDEQRLAWIERKLQEAGCALAPATCVMRDEATQRGERGGAHVSHGAVLFDGVLRVTDPDTLRTTIRQGIGAGKAYGFGLLSLAPTER